MNQLPKAYQPFSFEFESTKSFLFDGFGIIINHISRALSSGALAVKKASTREVTLILDKCL